MNCIVIIAATLVFTYIYAALAAKSRRAEMVLIPLLDILQSVPILGCFITLARVVVLIALASADLGADRHLDRASS